MTFSAFSGVARWFSIALLIFCGASYAESGAIAGRGGPYVEYHSASLSNFDSTLSGAPIVMGGIGLASIARNMRIGGAGGAGFVWNPSQNVNFGLGFGGLVGEMAATNWLNFRLMIGGGGYSVAKVTTETDTERVLDKISSGGFFLFHPSMNADIPLSNTLKLSVGAGYFLPNVSALQSATFNVGLNFAK